MLLTSLGRFSIPLSLSGKFCCFGGSKSFENNRKLYKYTINYTFSPLNLLNLVASYVILCGRGQLMNQAIFQSSVYKTADRRNGIQSSMNFVLPWQDVLAKPTGPWSLVSTSSSFWVGVPPMLAWLAERNLSFHCRCNTCIAIPEIREIKNLYGRTQPCSSNQLDVFLLFGKYTVILCGCGQPLESHFQAIGL